MLTSSLSYKVVTFFLSVVILLGCLLSTFVIIGKEKRKKFVCFCCCFLTALIESMGGGFSVNVLFVGTLCVPNLLVSWIIRMDYFFVSFFGGERGQSVYGRGRIGGMCM